jgi:ubiquitin fusion degradation protein 1
MLFITKRRTHQGLSSDTPYSLEQALRNFTCLTQGDIIEIIYNSIVFRLLVMEAKPENAPGISVFETDLEVDFATPVGYKEPERLKPPPQATMASKLGIKLEDTTPLSSRPGSAMGIAAGAPTADGGFEAFKGRGETLNGRKTKGKGKAGRKITEVDPDSKIIRT